jgi:hypothetical protein
MDHCFGVFFVAKSTVQRFMSVFVHMFIHTYFLESSILVKSIAKYYYRNNLLRVV